MLKITSKAVPKTTISKIWLPLLLLAGLSFSVASALPETALADTSKTQKIQKPRQKPVPASAVAGTVFNFSATSYSGGNDKAKTVVKFTAAKNSSDSLSDGANMDLADPLEGFNRFIFAINDGLDFIIFRPVAYIYKTVFPEFVRRMIANFMANIATPITLTNDILQGEWQRAETTFVRFLINSTAGIGGLDDLAARAGYPRHFEDFGQTLAVYGVPSGPYIVLPIIGPHTPRHIIGRIADIFVNPWTYILYDEEYWVQAIPAAVEFLNARTDNLETLDAVRATSPDFYSSIKSIYWQNRLNEIANGMIIIEDLPEIPD